MDRIFLNLHMIFCCRRGYVTPIANISQALFFILYVLLLAPAVIWADVSVNKLFTGNLVLQQGMVTPVWGTAGPGEKVTVTLYGRSKETTADAAGKWMVNLDAMSPAENLQMVIQGNKRPLPC